MSENLNYEKCHQKYKTTVSYVEKIKLQVVLFSHITFWTKHLDMLFFWKKTDN